MTNKIRRLFRSKSEFTNLRRGADAKRDGKDYAEAARLYESALALRPKEGPLHVQCGHMFKEAGTFGKAEAHYMRAMELMPNDADLRLQLGHFFKVTGKYEHALSAYSDAAKLAPGWMEPINEASNLSKKTGIKSSTGPRDDVHANPDKIDISHIFIKEFYAEQSGVTVDGYQHYRTLGWKIGLDPHPLFSTTYYLKVLDRPLVGDDPLSDFVRLGIRTIAEVHPLLDAERYGRLCPDAVQNGSHPLIHYMSTAGRDRIDGLRFFDTDYYLEQCPGLMELGFPPLIHYVRFGWKEGRKPHRQFDTPLMSKLSASEKTDPLTEIAERCLQKQPLLPQGLVENSIIILNLEKSLLTLQCVYFVEKFTDLSKNEIIIFDNGSSAEQFELLAKYASKYKIIRSDVNLGFGEANNVAAEAATGRNLVFLNNDAFVTEGWLSPLVDAVSLKNVAAAGPLFIYPDGRIQEAGATVSFDGHVHQRGKGLAELHPRYLRGQVLDYVSAAALLIRTDVFRKLLGFDLMWDPAYFEDVDLCLKLKTLELDVVYEPKSRVIHIENSTSGDASLNLKLHTIVDANRLKFIQRWGDYLDSRDAADLPTISANEGSQRTPQARPLMALYTAYPLNPGGGERYLLSFANEFREEFDCILYTPQWTSGARLITLGRELNLDLSHVRCVRWALAATEARPDIFICIGNEILPYVDPIGRENYFICQFPFPMQAENYRRDWDKLGGYDIVLVYSEFVREQYCKLAHQSNLRPPPLHVLSPAVMPMRGGVRQLGHPRRILNVGRFHPGGHCKRQDVMIDAFKDLLTTQDQPIELHLAGSLGNEPIARDYLASLREASKSLPIFLHLNVSFDQLQTLFGNSDVYWHLTGINDNPQTHPERFEHFGITILEAMSAGMIPVVLRHGGPAEIIQEGRNGFLVGNRDELVITTKKVLSMSDVELDGFRHSAEARAEQFSPELFKQHFSAVMQGRRHQSLPSRGDL